MNSNKENLKDEFAAFLSADEINPSPALNDVVLQMVNSELNPSSYRVFMKVIGIHAVISLFTLSLCSQFGFQTLPRFDLMNHFMSVVGPTYCMAFCGAIYLGVSALVLSLLMKPEEVRTIRHNKLLQMTLLSGVSLGVFLCLGASLFLLPTALWIFGALVGGVGTLELGWLVRSQFRKRLVYGI